MNSIIENQLDKEFFTIWDYYKCVTDIQYFAEKYVTFFNPKTNGKEPLKIDWNRSIKIMFPKNNIIPMLLK